MNGWIFMIRRVWLDHCSRQESNPRSRFRYAQGLFIIFSHCGASQDCGSGEEKYDTYSQQVISTNAELGVEGSSATASSHLDLLGCSWIYRITNNSRGSSLWNHPFQIGIITLRSSEYYVPPSGSSHTKATRALQAILLCLIHVHLQL